MCSHDVFHYFQMTTPVRENIVMATQFRVCTSCHHPEVRVTPERWEYLESIPAPV